MTQKACIGVGYKREIQAEVKPGGDKRSEEYHSGHISLMVPAPPSGQSRDLAAAKVGVSGKVVAPVFPDSVMRPFVL